MRHAQPSEPLNMEQTTMVVRVVSEFLSAAAACGSETLIVRELVRQGELLLSRVWDSLGARVPRRGPWTRAEAVAYLRAAAEILLEHLGPGEARGEPGGGLNPWA